MKIFMSVILGLALLVGCSANVDNYHEQGGSRWVVGGTLFLNEAGEFEGTNFDKFPKVKTVTLSAAATSAGVLAWANPTASTIIVERLILYTTTKSDSASTVDCGVGASATTVADNLIDGVDLGTSAGVFDNITNAGSNGKAVKTMTSSQYITCSKASGAVTGLVGTAEIQYLKQ